MIKRLGYITVAFAVFWISFSQLVIYTTYHVNKAEITALFCINKSEPRLKCDGKCHLQSKFAENNTELESTEAISGISWIILFHNPSASDSSADDLQVQALSHIPISLGLELDAHAGLAKEPPKS